MSQSTKTAYEVAQTAEPGRLSAFHYERLCDVLGEAVGIHLTPGKKIMLEGRLRRRIRAIGGVSIDDYCALLFDQGGLAEEMPHLINAVTTNKTAFFREPQHFDLLERQLVPALIALRPRASMPILKIWSAAASNGAEAYTIAMILADLLLQRRDFRFSVLGTDISTDMIDDARMAIYANDMMAPVPPQKLARYVMQAKDTAYPADVRIAPDLRRLVQFQHLNLMDTSYPIDHDVDVIFLRNVLIYFEKDDQQAVIERLLLHLRRGGYLILGHAESMVGTSLAMKQFAPAVFQKP